MNLYITILQNPLTLLDMGSWIPVCHGGGHKVPGSEKVPKTPPRHHPTHPRHHQQPQDTHQTPPRHPPDTPRHHPSPIRQHPDTDTHRPNTT